MVSIEDVVLAARKEFEFLERNFKLVESSTIFPQSFKGGFKLIFRSSSSGQIEISYTDYEFLVLLESQEIFGPHHHPSFAGNMFSREHLLDALPGIRQSIEKSLKSLQLLQ